MKHRKEGKEVDLSRETKGFLKGILVFSVLGLVIGFFVVPSTIDTRSYFQIIRFDIPFFNLPANISYAIGVAVGAIMAAIKCLLLERAVNKALKMENKQRASLYMRAGYMPRFLLTGLALFASVFFLGFFGIIGAIIGTMSLTLSAYIVGVFERKSSKRSAEEISKILESKSERKEE
ncbi:MAG: hypothetical protein FWE44_01620 [Defluviitaleaceae bacterium]|nr:hypothetical protein [Defluviitaleaceae bacterium]